MLYSVRSFRTDVITKHRHVVVLSPVIILIISLNNMEKTYKNRRLSAGMLLGTIIFILLIPVIVCIIMSASFWEFIFINALMDILFSPFIVFLIILIKILNQREISISQELIRYRSSKSDITIRWNEVIYIVFDYIRIWNWGVGGYQYCQVYELGNDKDRVRFSRHLGFLGKKGFDDYTRIGPFNSKSFRFDVDAYGLSMDNSGCDDLLKWISGHTGIAPSRRRELA
jgi:hypothetical protein